ncbi:class I SAM-dependent methyltransferase [Massilia sp. W12]|uniref:class I SAM-dependent methyltransferase n=1 Tax=Massilia sp. W12 TaxID=3126507 RepID=UPI0030D2B73E
MSVSALDYQDKQAAYFANARREIAPLLARLPQRPIRVLELGCGNGATLAWLRSQTPVEHASGVELFADAAQQAAQQAERILQGNLEQMLEQGALPFQAGEFDLILCMDVLEHLVDPWRVTRACAGWLRPGGLLIASIPNVRNWRALLPLLFAARWEYSEAGILDRTHLRFFTGASARALLTQAGLQIDDAQRLPFAVSPKARWANRLSLGLLRDFLTLQFLLTARKPGP